MSKRMDDFDLEVSALETASAQEPADPDDSDAVSSADDTTATAPSTPSARRIFLAARRSRAQQLVRAGSAVTLLLLLVTAVLLVPAGNRDALLRLVTPPTPFPTSVPQAGDDRFLWEHSVPWGRLLIDGQPGPTVSGPAMASFQLTRGRHTLEYAATSFPTLRCTVSVPFTRDDTCPLDRALDGGFVGSGAPLTRVLDLQATIDRLSPTQTAALVAATQARLSAVASDTPSGTLAVGDHYVDARDTLQQVTLASVAHALRPQFHLASSVDNYMGVACVTLCTRTGLGENYNAQGWALLAPVDLTWRYYTVDGGIALDTGPSGPAGAQRSMLIPVVATLRQGSWQVDAPVYGLQSDPVVCVTGQHYREVLQLTPGQTAIDDQNFPWSYAAEATEQGCLYAGAARDRFSGKLLSPIALVLYRAGVLLAVNAMAHEVYPSLPMASAHERALANAVAPTQLE